MGQPVCADRRAWRERGLSCGAAGAHSRGPLCDGDTRSWGTGQAHPALVLNLAWHLPALLRFCSSPWDCDNCHPGAQPLCPSRRASLSPTPRPHCRTPSRSRPHWCFSGLWEVKSGSPHHLHPQPPSGSSCAGGAVRPETQGARCLRTAWGGPEQRPSGSPSREARVLPDAPTRTCAPASLRGRAGRGLAGALRPPSRCPGVRQGYRPRTFRVRCGNAPLRIPELVPGLRLGAVTDVLTATLPFGAFVCECSNPAVARGRPLNLVIGARLTLQKLVHGT